TGKGRIDAAQIHPVWCVERLAAKLEGRFFTKEPRQPEVARRREIEVPVPETAEEILRHHSRDRSEGRRREIRLLKHAIYQEILARQVYLVAERRNQRPFRTRIVIRVVIAVEREDFGGRIIGRRGAATANIEVAAGIRDEHAAERPSIGHVLR